MVALALAGFILSWPWRGRGGAGPWPWLAAVGVFIVFGLPVLLSGADSFLGYVKLDDTSTWLAFTDHVLEYGRSVEGLAPSSHEATVQINLTAGYPIGAFIPLAVGSELTATDPAWLFQPYLAFMAALMALSFFELAGRVVGDGRIRAAAVFIAAQPALLIGFAWWGGIKEIATAQILALLAASVIGLADWSPKKTGTVAAGIAGDGGEAEKKPGKNKKKEKDRKGSKDSKGKKDKAEKDGKTGSVPAPAPAAGPPSGAATLRAVLPAPIVAGSALIGVMGFGGMPWLFAFALGVVILMAWRARGELTAGDFGPDGILRTYLARIGLVALGLLVIAVPTMFASGSFFSPTQGPLTSGEEMGNLIAALNPAQYAGPWPVADFRLAPDSELLTVLLVFATIVAFGFGVWAAIEKRAVGLLILVGGTGLGSLIIWVAGSPWVQGKALATGTASFLLLAMVGIATLITAPSTFDFSRPVARAAGAGESFATWSYVLFSRAARTGASKEDWLSGLAIRLARAGKNLAGWFSELASRAAGAGDGLTHRIRLAGVVLLVVPAGVLVSNAMAFGDVWVAPKDQLTELERIGEDYAGQGPALMTEYHPHGVRHLLRELDAEGASELRRRTIPLTDGSTAEKGAWVDTDQLQTDPNAQGLFTYPTLVLRRSPQQSRPPSPYRLAESGRFYEVWQLEPGFDPATLIERLPLGEGIDPAGIAPCPRIGRLAEAVGPNGRLVGFTRNPVAAAAIDSAPPDWSLDTNTGTFVPGSSGTAAGRVELTETGRWMVFLGGSTRGRVTVEVDGAEVGSGKANINNNGQYIEIGPANLRRGIREVTVDYEKGSPLSPGTRTTPGFPLGPLIFAYASNDDRLIEVPAANYRELCGKRLDWVEAFAG